jgi:AcrR family transcriptional regulator
MPKTNNHLEKILDVSQNLFFNYGYNAVSMSSIAQSVNITKAALYYHFENKEDLYLSILKKNLLDFKSCIDEKIKSPQFKNYSLKKKIEEIITIYFNFVNDHNNTLKLLVKKIDTKNKKIINFLSKARMETIATFKSLSEEIIKHNNNKIINHHDMTLFLFGMMTPFIQEEIHNYRSHNSKNIAKKICSILIT